MWTEVGVVSLYGDEYCGGIKHGGKESVAFQFGAKHAIQKN